MSEEFTKKIWPFHIIAEKIYQFIRRTKIGEGYFDRLGEDLKILYPQNENTQILKQYISYKIMCVLIFVFAVILLFFVYSFALKEDISLSELKRQNYYGDDENDY